MKSCLGILIVFFTFVSVVGGGALIWYLSSNTEFSRTAPAAGVNTAPAPKATPAAQRPAPSPAKPRTAPVAPARPLAPSSAKPAPSQPSSPFGEKR